MKKKSPERSEIKQVKDVKGWRTIGDPTEYQSISGKECTITLERLSYSCSRGSYIAKLFPTGALKSDIDNEDCHPNFPRLYFDETRAKLEIEAWLEKRGQQI